MGVALSAVPFYIVYFYENQSKINGCGSVCMCAYERTCTVLCSQGHSVANQVSAIWNLEGPLVGGCFSSKPIYFLIHAKISVLLRVVKLDTLGESNKGGEAPLYIILYTNTTSSTSLSV